MTLAELEEIALANNPTLARGAARVQAARGQWVQAGLPPNPVVGYLGSEMGNEGRAGQQGAYVGQEFVRGGKLRLNRAVVAQEIRQGEQELWVQRYRVLNDVRVGFYEVLVAERVVDLSRELVNIGEQSVTAAEQLIEAGEVSRVDLLQARVETNAARIQLENARNQYEAAWRSLTAILGVPAFAPSPLAGDLEAGLAEIDWEGAMQSLLTGSPELAAAQTQIDRARAALRRARAEPVPNLDLMLSAQHDNATQDTVVGVQAGTKGGFGGRKRN
jgi:cobalt-zinc-cadmium efflux system outer membrane protein